MLAAGRIGAVHRVRRQQHRFAFEDQIRLRVHTHVRSRTIRRLRFSSPAVAFRAQRLRQQLPQRIERLRNHPRPGQHRHEIAVAIPARHDVPVQMPRAARPGDAVEIQTDVEALRLAAVRRARCVSRPSQSMHSRCSSRRHLGELGHVPPRRDHQVAVVVRIAIQHDHRLRAACRHEQLAVDRPPRS